MTRKTSTFENLTLEEKPKLIQKLKSSRSTLVTPSSIVITVTTTPTFQI